MKIRDIIDYEAAFGALMIRFRLSLINLISEVKNNAHCRAE